MTASSSARLGVLLATSFLATLLLPLPARAQPAPPTTPPTEEQVEAGRALYREARDLHKQGRVKEALEKALAAYRTASTPVTALEAGELFVEAGRLVEARDLLRGVPLLPVSPRESDKGRESRQQAANLAGQLDMRIPKLAFADRPTGSELVLDGKPLPPIDATAWQGVDPGAHTLLVRLDERICTTLTLALSEGEERTVDLHDATAACAAPSILPPVPPSALPSTPRPRPPVPPAAHPSPAGRWLGVVAAGAGVVAVTAGGVLALTAKGQYDSVAGECPSRGCTQDGFDTRTSARSRADAATWIMSAGGAAVVGGVVIWLLADPKAQVAAGMLGPGTLGLVGAF